MMHASFQIHLLLTAVNDTLASRNEGTHVSHVHRFLVKACHVPEEKLEHIDFVCTTAKWNAVKWNARHKLFGTTIALGIHCWMVVPTQTLFPAISNYHNLALLPTMMYRRDQLTSSPHALRNGVEIVQEGFQSPHQNGFLRLMTTLVTSPLII